MSILFALSLTSSLIVLALYPVFNAMVSHCRAFQYNRIVMLAGISIAVIIPMVLPLLTVIFDLSPITVVREPSLSEVSANYSALQFEHIDSQYRNILVPLVLCIYLTGMSILILREILAYIKLSLIFRKSYKIQKKGCIICRYDDNGLKPFSWGRYIVFGNDEINPVILTHEKAHIDKRHWIDGVIADLFCIFLWYNPFVWMLKRLIKLNHEYEADAKVIETSSDILSYQRLLITKAIGNRSLPIANNFAMNKRDFRKRVLAMNKPQSTPKIRWYVLLAISAVAFAVYANSTSISSRILNIFRYYDYNNLALKSAKVKNHEDGMESVGGETMGTLVIQRIPSPYINPEPLLKRFKVSFEAADKELLPEKIVAQIEADENGNIVSVMTDNDDNPEVRFAVDRATDGLQFEVVKDGGKNIRMHFAIPITKSDLPY